jgi:hypothetical protein
MCSHLLAWLTDALARSPTLPAAERIGAANHPNGELARDSMEASDAGICAKPVRGECSGHLHFDR